MTTRIITIDSIIQILVITITSGECKISIYGQSFNTPRSTLRLFRSILVLKIYINCQLFLRFFYIVRIIANGPESVLQLGNTSDKRHRWDKKSPYRAYGPL